MIWLGLAFAADCPLTLQTRMDFRAEEGAIRVLGDGAGWRKDRMKGLSPSGAAKIELYKSAWKRYPVDVQEALIAGNLPDNLDEVAMAIAYGEPDFMWETKDCRVLLYGVDTLPSQALMACDGAILQRATLSRAISCGRLTEVAPRLDKGRKTLATYSLVQQLDVVGGHRAEWMDAAALELTFGKGGKGDADLGPVTGAVAVAPVAPVVPVPVVPVEPAAPVAAIQPVQGVVERTEPVSMAEETVPVPVAVAVAPKPRAPDVPMPKAQGRAAQDVFALPRGSVDVLSSAGGATVALPAHMSFTVTCGSVPHELTVDLEGRGFKATSASRAAGQVTLRNTRGGLVQGEGATHLLGLGSAHDVDGAVVLTLGAWPSTACLGQQVRPLQPG